jgi:hypothetical protein
VARDANVANVRVVALGCRRTVVVFVVGEAMGRGFSRSLPLTLGEWSMKNSGCRHQMKHPDQHTIVVDADFDLDALELEQGTSLTSLAHSSSAYF